jgi:flagellar biosynthetic protein FliR
MARLIMSALDVAGTLIANQTGLAFAQTFNPSLSASTTVVGTFLSLLGAMLVFESNLHHLAIGAIRGSYDLMPPDGALMTADYECPEHGRFEATVMRGHLNVFFRPTRQRGLLFGR